jgi:hypothetical protein
MAALKITNFLGIAPKIASELLPDTAAQIAKNVKLYSGDLIPYPQPVAAGTTGRSGTVRTLYGLRNPNTDAVEWLSWLTDVNVAVATSNKENNQRFYYTGSGVPKVSDYTLATTGTGPYPIAYYDLGLPVPTGKPTIATTAFTAKTSASFARDASGIATLVTSTPHGLRTGSTVTVSGFTFVTGTYVQSGGTTITVTITNHGLANGASVTLDFTSGTAVDGTFTIGNVTASTFDVTSSVAATTSGVANLDIRSFNVTNIDINVVDGTTFTYSSPGFQITTTANTSGKIDLGGFDQNRTYAYSWYTPWEEESIASSPSNELILKEGQVVTVTNLPSVKPSGNNFVRGIRLYRTIPSSAGTKYFLLNTLWFPVNLTRVERAGNIARVTTGFPHNLSIDDRFKVANCDVGSFNITGGIVTDVIDNYTFEYSNPGADEFSTPVSNGQVFYDVSQTPGTSTPQYWGDGGSYTFTDDFNASLLLTSLDSDNYDAPPSDLKGLVAIQNNVLAGFVANEVYFTPPNIPHAWPAEYKVTIEPNIVGLAAIGGSLLILTESYPYIVQGSDPAAGFTPQKIDLQYPCLNPKSVVTMSGGVVWSTHDGLAYYSPFAGAQLVTKFNYNNDTWSVDLDPTTVVASFYGDIYLASHSTGSFTFERDEKTGGIFTTISGEDSYLLTESDGFILTESGGRILLEGGLNPLIFTSSWYDSVYNKLYYTVGNSGDIFEWDNLGQAPLALEWKSKTFRTKDMINLGAARVIADYSDLSDTSLVENWENVTANWEAENGTYETSGQVTFYLWVNKKLKLVKSLSDSGTFRMPTGYRADTFEVGVKSTIRVREIHLAETPIGLKEA